MRCLWHRLGRGRPCSSTQPVYQDLPQAGQARADQKSSGQLAAATDAEPLGHASAIHGDDASHQAGGSRSLPLLLRRVSKVRSTIPCCKRLHSDARWWNSRRWRKEARSQRIYRTRGLRFEVQCRRSLLVRFSTWLRDSPHSAYRCGRYALLSRWIEFVQRQVARRELCKLHKALQALWRRRQSFLVRCSSPFSTSAMPD